MKHLLIAALISLCSAAFAKADEPFMVPIAPDGVQRVEIIGGDYFFRPSHMVVKVNKPVEMKISKQEKMVPHNIVIDAPDAAITVRESLDREPKTIFFVPSKTGRFPFYCDKKLPMMKSHREKGMEGILEVVD